MAFPGPPATEAAPERFSSTMVLLPTQHRISKSAGDPAPFPGTVSKHNICIHRLPNSTPNARRHAFPPGSNRPPSDNAHYQKGWLKTFPPLALRVDRSEASVYFLRGEWDRLHPGPLVGRRRKQQPVCSSAQPGCRAARRSPHLRQ